MDRSWGNPGSKSHGTSTDSAWFQAKPAPCGTTVDKQQHDYMSAARHTIPTMDSHQKNMINQNNETNMKEERERENISWLLKVHLRYISVVRSQPTDCYSANEQRMGRFAQ